VVGVLVRGDHRRGDGHFPRRPVSFLTWAMEALFAALDRGEVTTGNWGIWVSSARFQRRDEGKAIFTARMGECACMPGEAMIRCSWNGTQVRESGIFGTDI